MCATRLTTTKYSSNLNRSWSASTSPTALNHSLEVYYLNRLIMAFKCISKLNQLRPPSLHLHGLHVHLQTRTIKASKWIIKLAGTLPPSVSPTSHNYNLQVCSITASKCFSKHAQSWPWSASLSLPDHDVVKRRNWKADTASSAIRCTSHGIRREFLRKSHSGSRSVGRGWEDMKGYLAMMNHTNHVDLFKLGKTAWGTTQIEWIHERSARLPEEPHTLRGSIKGRQECVRNHMNGVDLLKLGNSAWDQQLGKIEYVIRIMWWCLSTLGSPKYILPVAEPISSIPVSLYVCI